MFVSKFIHNNLLLYSMYVAFDPFRVLADDVRACASVRSSLRCHYTRRVQSLGVRPY